MQQQRRREQTRYDSRPIDFLIEGVPLAAVMERTNNKGNQTKDVKVHRPRRVPSADENEQADEEIQQADNAEIILDTDGLVRRRGNQPGFKFFAVTREFIAKLGPKPGVIEAVRDQRGS